MDPFAKGRLFIWDLLNLGVVRCDAVRCRPATCRQGFILFRADERNMKEAFIDGGRVIYRLGVRLSVTLPKRSLGCSLLPPPLTSRSG